MEHKKQCQLTNFCQKGALEWTESQRYFRVSQQFPAGADQRVEERQLRSASGNIPVPKRLIASSHLDSISCAVENADALKHTESLHVVMF